MASKTSSSWWTRWWSSGWPRCNVPAFARYTWQSSGLLKRHSNIDQRILPLVQAMDSIFARNGYTVKSSGAYNCRAIKGTNAPSSHSSAIAIDINPAQNPWAPWVGGRLVTDIPAKVIREIEGIKSVATGNQAIFWGGRWKRYDPMHFQTIITPAEVRGGITVPGGIIIPPPPEEDDVRYVRRGDKNDGVGELQGTLKLLGHDLGAFGPHKNGIDNDYGGKTAAAVGEEQKAAKVAGFLNPADEGPDYSGPYTWAFLVARSGGGETGDHNHPVPTHKHPHDHPYGGQTKEAG